MTRIESLMTLRQATGEAPTRSSNGDASGDQLASRYLDEAQRRLAMKGLPTTREDQVTLEPHATSGEIGMAELLVGLPNGTKILDVRATSTYSSESILSIELRGDKLYHRDVSITDGSPWESVFDGKIRVTRIIGLSFDSLTPAMQEYITWDAAKSYWANVRSSKVKNRQTNATIRNAIMENWAQAKVTAENTNTPRANMLETQGARAIRGRTTMHRTASWN
tara:strand:+ start:4164 stop:4829 length:666 start_codon:yes stop_codon:yes gene_type:complete